IAPAADVPVSVPPGSVIAPVVSSDRVLLSGRAMAVLTRMSPVVWASGAGTPAGRPSCRTGDRTLVRSPWTRLSDVAALAASRVIARLPVNGASVVAAPVTAALIAMLS